ncbi:MAG TPA: lysophospholipid acyltransferase family protein [Magnetospirillaceae bacterium]|jgi:1-acyl-sn-glycerol-3-phosphate acyltransferase
MRLLNYWWRLGATGIAFACIFFGGGVLAVTVLPIIALASGHRRDHAQAVIRALFRIYIKALQALGLIRLEIEGVERLEAAGGRMIIANHPSLLDVVMLMALIPRAQCIVKHELWEHRFLGPVMRRAGYIRNDLAPEDMVAACRASLQAGDSLIIFPEGTRSRSNHPVLFRRGFANLATLMGAPIQPVLITCDPPTLIKGEPWWHIPPRRPLFRLVVDECMNVDDYMKYPYRSIAARRLVKFFENYYAEKLANVRV